MVSELRIVRGKKLVHHFKRIDVLEQDNRVLLGRNLASVDQQLDNILARRVGAAECDFVIVGLAAYHLS